MKMLILIIGLTFLIASQIYCQPEWEYLGLSGADQIQDIANDGNGYIYAGVIGGTIYRSTDNGISWELKNNGIDAGIGKKIEIYKNQIYLGTDNGLYKSSDCGENWVRIALSIEYFDFIDIKVLPNGYFFTSVSNQLAYGGVYRSTDFGETWLPTSFIGYGAMNIGINSNGVMFFCNPTAWWRGVYRSFDLGQTWERNIAIAAFAMCSIKEGYILIGTEPLWPGGLYESTNNGDSWYNTSNFNNDDFFGDFVVDINGDIYVSVTETQSGPQQGVYRSIDNGDSWSYWGLSNVEINCLSIDSSGYIYAGTNSNGIFRTPGRTVPVELTSFRADVQDGEVILNWSTATETNNKGFYVERKGASLIGNWEKIGFVSGSGTTTEPNSYTFTDNNVTTGNYSYRLKQIDYDGSFEYSKEVEVEVSVPLEFSLSQNYPNPFNPVTTIKYSVPKDGNVKLTVYNALGQELAELVNKEIKAANYEVEFNAKDLASGVYFYCIQAGDFVQSKKMILLK